MVIEVQKNPMANHYWIKNLRFGVGNCPIKLNSLEGMRIFV